MRRTKCLCMFLIGLMLWSSSVHGQKNDLAKHPDVASNIALLEIWLKANMAYSGLPGVTVGIIHDQKVIYANGFGYADVASKKPVVPNSIFRIASHSKLFTSIAIMQLRDKGKLRLEDPVKKHLSWFDIQDAYPDDPQITIRHLLTHTSGLPREAGSGYWVDFEFPTTPQVKNRLSQLQTIFPSETQFKYSNLALTLAGEIVAIVSGQPFAAYVQQHIIDPLGMTSTSVVFPTAHKNHLVTGYGRRMPDGTRAALPFVDAKGMAAATGVSSSVSDMARFVSWQFRLLESDTTEVLKASTLREMQRVHWLKPDWESGWGLGFSVEHKKDRDLIGHGGGYPGYLTYTHISPKEKIGVIVFTNALDAQVVTISDRIFEWVAASITKAVKGDKVEKPDPEWGKFEGTYRTVWTDSHVLILDGKLALIDPTASNPKPNALTLEPISENTFKMEGKGYGTLGEPVVFELGPDGKASRVKIGVNWANRVSY